MKSFGRIVVLCSLAVLPVLSSHAQSFMRGDNLVSVGLAAGSSLGNFHFTSVRRALPFNMNWDI
jgi:hypothetical protein